MKQTLKILPDAVGIRADIFVASQLTDYTRSFWSKQFHDGKVTHNGKPIKGSALLQEGTLIVEVPESTDHSIDIPIIYQDADVIVLNKPPGLLTHSKGVLNEEPTVADFVRPLTDEEQSNNRPGIVHRLDRDTSGVIIAAKNQTAKRWLQAQFSKRKVKKTYVALVEGILDKPKAIIRLPIERNPKKPQTFRVDSSGKPAETAYEVIKSFKDATLIRLMPQTGRTHQLRVHMAYLGHPIAGDRFYGSKLKVPRLFLHAQSLEVTLPNRKREVFEAPMPKDLKEALKDFDARR
ncbi:MAG TPA: RluA family pseudouridine synthase [Candidatus Saccharimonadales bacterium]|nr:RluA family pseudouridine synthase [Candidatus Saccharimonadales bacterium]